MRFSSTLEMEFPREWESDDLRLWAGVMVIGEFSREVPRERDVGIGDNKEPQMAGSVTLRCTDGREEGYGEKAGGFRELDRTRR